jgi:hypothetical protein
MHSLGVNSLDRHLAKDVSWMLRWFQKRGNDRNLKQESLVGHNNTIVFNDELLLRGRK